MKRSALHRFGRAMISLQRTGLLVPAAGMATLGASAYAMVAVAHAFPEAAMGVEGFGQCNPFAGDFGCGHGFGCACHLLPELPGPALNN